MDVLPGGERAEGRPAGSPRSEEGRREWRGERPVREPAGRPRMSRLAIVGLVLVLLAVAGFVAVTGLTLQPGEPSGIEGPLFGASFLLVLVALVLAAVALGKIGRSQGRLLGRRPALAALVSSIVSLVLFVPALAYLSVTQILRASDKREMAQRRLHQIGLAMHNHASNNGDAFPAAVAYRTRDGKPGLSWRVHLLPYLEGGDLYKSFRLNEPWDSPHNEALLTKMPAVYALPGKDKEARRGLTYFQVFVGKKTAFDESYARDVTNPGNWDNPFIGRPRRGVSINSLSNGKSNTILVVEAAQPVPWTKPEDLPYDPDGPLPPLGALSSRFFSVLMADGRFRTVRRDVPEAVLRYAITPLDARQPPPEWKTHW
jgi:hypothetical protein